MSENRHLLVLTTLPENADAGGFAKTLVDERLAACVSIFGGIRSVYRWQGDVAEDRERQIVIKTTAARLEPLMIRVRELHPYAVPELVALPVVGGDAEYLRWLDESTAPDET